jgi:FixJ family two-component response regulator
MWGDTERIDFLERRWRNEMGLDESRKGQPPPAWKQNSMIEPQLLVSVVDDDESVRESLPDLLKELGFAARTFSSAADFLASDHLNQASCLILDISMPGMNGPELKRELERRQLTIPVIFITANRDKALRARMLKNGAVECLFKPFSDTALRDALKKALPDK